MSKKLDKAIQSVVEGKSVDDALDQLTESLKLKTGEKVSVSHGIYAGWRGVIKEELPGGYYGIEVEGKTGVVPVPGFALGVVA
jgi:hypothetical protein